ncbi:ABC transporter permease [Actinomadura atramentaria]|uniref:ABC transporter permease n=1 Tax=Actinomadura atramentaria TaxID=1990 RepID=UPI00037105C9|nr:ABC transporter permease [Actinomadura atramentaria]
MSTDTSTAPAPAAAPAGPPPAALAARLTGLAARWSLVVLLVAFAVVFSLLRPGQFDTAQNAQTIAYSQSVIVVVALSALVSATVGEIDISIGAVMTTSGVATAWAFGRGWPPVAAVGLGLGCGLVIGAVNALLIVRARINSFIATLAMTTLLTGLALLLTDGLTLYKGVPQGFNDLVAVTVAGVPLMVVYTAVLALALAYLLMRTPVGRRMKAAGSGRAAAELIGVRTARYVSAALVLGSVIAAFGGVLGTARLQAAGPGGGDAVMLSSIAAVFLGAVVSRRGHLNVGGTVLAVLTLGVGITGLTMLGAPAWVPDVFNGLALVAALLISRAGKAATA